MPTNREMCCDGGNVDLKFMNMIILKCLLCIVLSTEKICMPKTFPSTVNVLLK